MKRSALILVAGAAMIAVAAFAPESLLDKQASVLKGANALNVTFTLRVGGVKSDYTLTYSKPNLLIIDGTNRLIESDGKSLWDYDKNGKTYTETPATPELLAAKAQSDEVLGWASFFTDDLLKKATNVQTGGSRAIKGQPTTEVTFTLGSTNPKIVTLYVDDKVGVARGFSFKGSNGDVLAMADKIELGSSSMSADKFVFSAPAGATKAVAPAPDAAVWANIQPILATNCTPCHGGARATAGFVVDTYDAVMKGASSGPVVVAGDPDSSRIVQLITGQAQPKMPPRRSVSDADVQKIKDWIKAGAKQ